MLLTCPFSLSWRSLLCMHPARHSCNGKAQYNQHSMQGPCGMLRGI